MTESNRTSKTGVDDQARLLETVALLDEIIERDEKRGLNTSGLETAKREIEWAARHARHARPTDETSPVQVKTATADFSGACSCLISKEACPIHRYDPPGL